MRGTMTVCRIGWDSAIRVLVCAVVSAGGIGCTGKRAPAADTLPAQLQEQHHIQVGGLDRTYRLFVPPSYGGAQPVPLVMLFHGGGGNGLQFARVTRADEVAAREGFIVVYPDGTPQVGLFGRGGDWNAGADPPQTPAEEKRVDDIAFVRALLENLEGQYRIDPKRVYAAGMSRGAMFSYHLACTLSDTLAAVAPVAGSMTAKNCQPKEPVAVLHIHGMTDQFVRLEGGVGRTKKYAWPAVDDGLAFWSKRNGCGDARDEVYDGAEAQCWRYHGCSSGRPVEFCGFDGGHLWPGKPKNPTEPAIPGMKSESGFSASERIWAFFKSNPK